MPTIEVTRNILHRHSGAILASGETVRAAAESALAGLSFADLREADLREADLTGANLIGANLNCADLHGANLSVADLSGVNLRYAYLGSANLSRANLSGAYLRWANLHGANLSGADLSDADLSDVNLSDTDLRDVNLPCVVPVVPDIDAAILAAIEAPGCVLDMSRYHTCGTTHCRAGWAIHLAGKAGYALEERVGSSAAGALIYAASRPDRRVPDFHASNEAALADLRKGLVRAECSQEN